MILYLISLFNAESASMASKTVLLVPCRLRGTFWIKCLCNVPSRDALEGTMIDDTYYNGCSDAQFQISLSLCESAVLCETVTSCSRNPPGRGPDSGGAFMIRIDSSNYQ